jgi:hypothetical protein
MKQFLAMHQLGDDLIRSGNLVQHVLTVFKAMKPFLVYIESVLGSNSRDKK